MATRKCRSLTLREILNEAAGLLLHPKNIVYERVADTQLLQYAVIRELHRGHLILEMVSNHVLLKRSKVLFGPRNGNVSKSPLLLDGFAPAFCILVL
jgi:hypothetical protein